MARGRARYSSVKVLPYCSALISVASRPWREGPGNSGLGEEALRNAEQRHTRAGLRVPARQRTRQSRGGRPASAAKRAAPPAGGAAASPPCLAADEDVKRAARARRGHARTCAPLLAVAALDSDAANEVLFHGHLSRVELGGSGVEAGFRRAVPAAVSERGTLWSVRGDMAPCRALVSGAGRRNEPVRGAGRPAPVPSRGGIFPRDPGAGW